jgi:hypothetical protein
MKSIFLIILSACLLYQAPSAQTLKLKDILDSIEKSYPSLKMYDATIQSLDAAAKGVRSWMSPQVSTGLWMTPYNTSLWKADGAGNTGMGQFMISAEQMFPNKKYNDANEEYMKAMSSVEKENKQATLNELFAAAKKNYYEWIMIEKKIISAFTKRKIITVHDYKRRNKIQEWIGKNKRIL